MSGQSVSELLQSAMIAAQGSQFDTVKTICNQVIELEPENPHALHMLGKVSEINLDLAQAITYYKQVAAIQEDEHIHLSIALLYQKGEEYELAINSYAKVLELDPSIEIAYQGISLCAQNDDLYDVGLQALSDIAKSTPSATHATLNYFQLLQHKIDALIENEKIESALANFMTLIQQANFLPVSFLSAKLIIEKGGIDSELTKSYEGIEEIFILCIVAMGYLFNESLDDAEQITDVLYSKLHDYLIANPDDNRAWRILSITAGIYKDKSKGNKVFRKFLSDLPDNILHLNAGA